MCISKARDFAAEPILQKFPEVCPFLKGAVHKGKTRGWCIRSPCISQICSCGTQTRIVCSKADSDTKPNCTSQGLAAQLKSSSCCCQAAASAFSTTVRVCVGQRAVCETALLPCLSVQLSRRCLLRRFEEFVRERPQQWRVPSKR